jgi:hypothetical protein
MTDERNNLPVSEAKPETVNRTAELSISIIFAQWLQAINKETPREVDLTDLIAGVFLCDPEGVASLADNPRSFHRYLRKECHVAAPAWLYQYQFSLRSQETEENVLMPFSKDAQKAIDQCESVAREKIGGQGSSVAVTVGDLLETILSFPGPIARQLARLGFTIEKVRDIYTEE